jgi:hypothetical protein
MRAISFNYEHALRVSERQQTESARIGAGAAVDYFRPGVVPRRLCFGTESSDSLL